MKTTTLAVLLSAMALAPAALASPGEPPRGPPPGPPAELPAVPAEAQAAPSDDAAHSSAVPAQASVAVQIGAAPAPMADGQWVFTGQYGWVWMPYGARYVFEPTFVGAHPYAFIYGPRIGWSWVAAPWVWGYGPRPHFGAWGWKRFGWYRPHFRWGPAPVRVVRRVVVPRKVVVRGPSHGGGGGHRGGHGHGHGKRR